MYTVEAEIFTVTESITYLPTESTGSEWSDIAYIPPLGTDQEELQEARKVAALAREYYKNVRIVKRGGSSRVVR